MYIAFYACSHIWFLALENVPVLEKNQINRFFFFRIFLINYKNQNTSTMRIYDKCSIYFKNKNFWMYPDECVPRMQHFAKDKETPSSTADICHRLTKIKTQAQ